MPTTTPAETLDGKSLDIVGEKSDRLRELFPEVWSEGKIDFNRLKAVLGETVYAGEERYGISWAGKYDAFKEIQKQTTATLIPERAESVNFDTSENVFIEGENLEVLRVLQKAYYGKVKMIYIDPPYNTGSDSFVYPDDYAERREEYEKRAGIRSDSGFLNKQDLWKKNTKENGQFHSVWLSMMYPRLYLARNLLREDGVIFVSIDDNEQANLKLLMDEVFGQENFVATIIWEKKYSPQNDATYFSDMHDYIFCYARFKKQVKSDSSGWQINFLPRTESHNARYKNPDKDPRGPWKSADFSVKTYSENYNYPIKTPSGKIVSPPKTRCWSTSKDNFEALVRDNRIWFGQDGDGVPALKIFLSEVKNGIVPSTLWFRNDVGDNELAKKQILELGVPFDTPKPTKLIKRMLHLSGLSNSNDIILDFFAGSCATAHAVLDLNREDGGNRRFLCVQMPEPTDEGSEAYKAGYRTIADIGRARIRKVLEKMKNEKGGALPLEENRQDLGFRAYKLQYSNFKLWRSDVKDAEGILKQLEAFRNPLVDGVADDREAILTEILLKAGIPLSASVEIVDTGGGTVFTVGDGRLWVALEQITPALLAAAVEAKPQTFVCLGALFRGENADEMMSNAMLELKEAGIEFKVI